jgi:integrase/recombinase XerD
VALNHACLPNPAPAPIYGRDTVISHKKGCIYGIQKKTTITNWKLGSVELQDAYTDFILSRQAALYTEETIKYYRYSCGPFVKWLEGQGIMRPDEINARHVRAYLAELAVKNSDRTVFDRASAIRTMVRFWHAENYIPQPVKFAMPKVEKKRLLSLDADNLKRVLSACDNPRDKALAMLMADSGARRQETINLNWGDVDIKSGLVRIQRGKGGKARSVVIGVTVRRALLCYRRLVDHGNNDPLFQTRYGGRFTGKGFREIFVRLSDKSGVHVTAHSLRRTFAILSLRAGMSPLHLQALLGHAGLEMVRHYAQMLNDDLLQPHKSASPVDHLGRL